MWHVRGQERIIQIGTFYKTTIYFTEQFDFDTFCVYSKGPPPTLRLSLNELVELRQIKLDLGILNVPTNCQRDDLLEPESLLEVGELIDGEKFSTLEKVS